MALPQLELGTDRIRPGDRVLVIGLVGDHSISVMLEREEFGMRGDLAADAARVMTPNRQEVTGYQDLPCCEHSPGVKAALVPLKLKSMPDDS